MSSILDVDVPFTDVQPFANDDFPLTFRAQVEARDTQNWTISSVELPNRHDGSWNTITRAHPAYPICFDYVTGDAGYERIEDAIRTAMAEARERAAWDRADAAHELEAV